MSWFSLIELAMIAGVPLILAVIGELALQRSGMINIGLEGMLLAAALTAVLVARGTGSAMAGIAGGVAGAAMLALLFGVMTIHLRTDQVVTGAALNFIGAGVTAFLYGRSRSSLMSGVPLIEFRSALVIFAWVIAPLAVAFLLFRTRAGLRLRACGDYPDAIALQGLSVARYRWLALGIEALMAGAAGAAFSLMLTSGFAENMTAGRGFIALAIVILARWHPFGAVAGAALFSLTIALQYALQAGRLELQFHLLLALPYVVTLLVLALVTAKNQGPRYLGR